MSAFLSPGSRFLLRNVTGQTRKQILPRCTKPAIHRPSIRQFSSSIPRFNDANSSLKDKPREAAITLQEIYDPLETFDVASLEADPKPSTHHQPNWNSKKVYLTWADNQTSQFHNIWLRDHCRCANCRHPDTLQKLVDVCSLPEKLEPTAVETLEDGVRITWQDSHESFFTYKWLHLHSYAPRLKKYYPPRFSYWDSSIASNPPVTPYEWIMSSDFGVAEWTRKIYVHGFSFVSGVPPTPEATEALLNRIAFIRNTHYGGFWEVIPDLSSKDMAYTSAPLRAHTDTTYFSDPCGLQLFHMLSHTGGEGGESLLVDGFRAANILRKEHPDAYKILSKVRVPAHASGNHDVSIRPYAAMPTFIHHPVNGELVQLRWNPDDRGTMDRWADEKEMGDWYKAVRLWEKILRSEENEYVFQLQPGMPVIFDNWRVLHGRKGFTGVRRFCGGYINRDDFYSRYLLTNCGRERVIEAI